MHAFESPRLFRAREHRVQIFGQNFSPGIYSSQPFSAQFAISLSTLDNRSMSDQYDEAADLERSIHHTETAAQSASRILRENAIRAAMSIVHLASRSESERVRLAAATYVVEHAFLASSLGHDTLNSDEQMQIMGTAISEIATKLGHDVNDPVTRELIRQTLVNMHDSGMKALEE